MIRRKGVNVMGELMDSIVAVMGLAAGLMVVLTTLLSGNGPTRFRQDESHHDPHTLRLSDERRAA